MQQTTPFPKTRICKYNLAYLWHSRLTIASSRCLPVVITRIKKSPQLVGLRPPICWTIFFSRQMVCGELGFGSCANRKPTHDFAVWPELQHQIIPHPPISTPFWVQGVPEGSKMVAIEVLTPHSYSTSIHTIGPSCTIGHNTQRGRCPTDRAIG